MRILVCPDKFKGSFASQQVAKRLRKALRKTIPEVEVDLCPLADGGEGFDTALAKAWGVKAQRVSVVGPMGNRVRGKLVWKAGRGGEVASLAMSSASGLDLVPVGQENAWLATTFGVGQLIATAVELGATTIFVGLGGSATTDGGLGMAEALGFLPQGLQGPLVVPDWVGKVKIVAACDVTIPLLGPKGCVRVFGPQKGVTKEEFPKFEQRLKLWVKKIESTLPKVVGQHTLPGSGAAGGLGYALRVLLGAEICSGFDVVARAVDLDARLAVADAVVTGEGCLDASSFHGKVVGQVLERCKNFKKFRKRVPKPCFVLCGRVGDVSASAFTAVQATGDLPFSSQKKQLRQGAKKLAAVIYEKLLPFETRS